MEDLSSLKYSELQKLAKQAGLKANVKRDKLREMLSAHSREKEENQENEPQNENQERGQVTKRQKKTKQTKTPRPESGSWTKSVESKASNKTVSKIKTGNTTTPNTHNQSPILFSPATKLTPKPRINSFSKVTPHRQTPTLNTPVVSILKGSLKASSPKPVTPKTRTPIGIVRASKVVRNVTPKASGGKRKLADIHTTQSDSPHAKRRRTFDKVPTPEHETIKAQTPQPGSSKTNRRRTFDKAPTPELETAKLQTPEPQSRTRRSTFDKVSTPDLAVMKEAAVSPGMKKSSRQLKKSASPGVSTMLDAMKPDMNNEEMKQSLMSAIDKKVQEKCKTESAQNGSKLPRFMALLAKKREEKKPVTPGNKDWTKIHKKNFEKFESIDVYLAKKRKRAEEITTSVKKAKQIVENVHNAVDKLKANRTPQSFKSENKGRKSRPSNVSKTPFNPVLNVKNIDFNFRTTKSPKTLPRKTLPRKSPASVLTSETKKRAPLSARKSTGTVLPSKTGSELSTGTVLPSKTGSTPFKFTGSLLNNTTLSTVSAKKTFDLQASLARPITWRPHTGKLKPLEANQSSPAAFKRPVQSVTKSRNTRRVNMMKRRADNKQTAHMTRRGLNVS